jgi:hypothetical protein
MIEFGRHNTDRLLNWILTILNENNTDFNNNDNI